jgi:hypothetical protein
LGALTIAFDITIVGALALPWVFLVIHLFFSEGENHVKHALDWVNHHQAQIPAGILLFAMTYTLGSAVSRIAQDFFNDDDIYIEFAGKPYGHLLRWPVTEDRIRAHVYCDPPPKNPPTENSQEADSGLAREIWDPALAGEMAEDDRQGLVPKVPSGTDSAMASEMQGLKGYGSVCQYFMAGWIPKPKDGDNPARFVKIMAHVFGLQENTLMDKGDYSARLRQLHDQIMVLRGAAFNGLIAFSLCLFAWGSILTRRPAPGDKARSRNEAGSRDKSAPGDKPRPWGRWTFAVAANVFAILLTALALIAGHHHLANDHLRFPPDPPYLEFTLVLLAIAGMRLLWFALPRSLDTREPKAEQAGDAARCLFCSSTAELEVKNWGPLVALSFILTLAAFLGWWSTEVIYRDQVVYSYDSQFSGAQGSAKVRK